LNKRINKEKQYIGLHGGAAGPDFTSIPRGERFFALYGKILSPYGQILQQTKQFIINQLPHGEISTYKAEKGLPT
jgi:hypothetical protein